MMRVNDAEISEVLDSKVAVCNGFFRNALHKL